MSRDDHAHLYQVVPVLFWPWLWWQLFRLRLWVAATGRDVLCGVDRWGNLHVHLVGDDPARWTPSRHPHLHQYYLTEDLPDETRKRVAKALRTLRGKELSNPWKKHDNIPL